MHTRPSHEAGTSIMQLQPTYTDPLSSDTSRAAGQVVSSESVDFSPFAEEFFDLHRRQGISVDFEADLSPVSTVSVCINGRECRPPSPRQYNASLDLVLTLLQGKKQTIRDTFVDVERRVIRVVKTTFTNDQKSGDSISDYYFDVHDSHQYSRASLRCG